jgi:hypothetical protein
MLWLAVPARPCSGIHLLLLLVPEGSALGFAFGEAIAPESGGIPGCAVGAIGTGIGGGMLGSHVGARISGFVLSLDELGYRAPVTVSVRTPSPSPGPGPRSY